MRRGWQLGRGSGLDWHLWLGDTGRALITHLSAPINAELRPHEDAQAGDDSWEETARGLVGAVIRGRYRIDALLGAGSMAFVLDGWDLRDDRRVAIKVLHPELSQLAEIRARFEREALAASRVAHPAVIAVTECGVSEGGLHYLVMEHLVGVDLQRWASAWGRLPASIAASVGIQLAGALDAIHQAGYVHRDIKPENIFVLDGDGAVPAIKVLDLGIAAVQAQRPSKDDPRLTRAGQTLGTVHFMAPEQVAARPLDGRTDVYAAGCVLFELVTGEVPFSAATSTEIMMAHLREKPRAPSSLCAVPEWLSAVILRCLEKRPEHRFANARALGAALSEGLRQSEPQVAKPDATSEEAVAVAAQPTMAETVRSRRALVLKVIAFCAGAVLAAAAALAIWAALE